MVEPPVDFAIIAALKVEREAMVQRLMRHRVRRSFQGLLDLPQ